MGRAPARNAVAIHGYYRVSRPQFAPVMDTVIIAVLVAKPRAKPSIPAVTAIAMARGSSIHPVSIGAQVPAETAARRTMIMPATV